MKKQILLIPDSDYLSIPIFVALTKVRDSRTSLIYMNPSFPVSKEGKSDSYRTEAIRESFHQYETIDIYYFNFFLEYFNKSIFKKIVNLPHVVVKYRNYSRAVFNKFDSLHPDAIVLTSDKTNIGAIANKWAARNNIPIIIIQSAFMEGGKVGLLKKVKRLALFTLINRLLQTPYAPRQFKYGHESDRSYVFIWGSYFQEYFLKKARDRIIITGNPIFDNYSNGVNLRNEKIDSLANNKPVISIFTMPYLNVLNKKQEKIVSETYRQLIVGNPEWYFVIKTHPRERKGFYERLLENNRTSNYHITNTGDISGVLGSSDVQVSLFSYTSFQAVIAGVPIILFKDEYIKHHDNFNNEIELRANNLIELENAIILSLSDDYKEEYKSKRRQYLDTRLHSLDRRSSERVINCISDITSAHIISN
jgi:hypothetical protein